MTLVFDIATEGDAAAIATLRTAVAERLTEEHGRGHWSNCATEKGVLRGITTSYVLVGRAPEEHGEIVATLRLATKKPWAIDVAYFTPVKRAIYLLDMAVAPEQQRRGLGRGILDEASRVARDWPADAVRLDAYDAPAGAGPFYAKCGYAERGRVAYRGTPLIYYELCFG